MFREGRRWWHGHEGKKSAQVFRRRRQKLSIPFHHLLRLFQRPERRSGADGANRMQPEEKRSDDAEVAAAAANRPEEVLVLPLAGRYESPVRQYHVGGQ